MKSFMKYSYVNYFKQLPNGKYIPISRAECFAIDADNPAKNQRWLYDEEEHFYAIRLAPTAEGKQMGNDHAAELKRESRRRGAYYGCAHKNNGCVGGDCENCPNYVSRTSSLDAKWTDEGDGENPVSRFEPASDYGNPDEELEKSAGWDALVDFLETLCEADRLLWECWRDGMKDREIADKLGLKQRKSVYDRKKKLEAKIKADTNLKEFYGN